MAEQCAACGRSDLLQPDVANYQCLACGALTSIATNQVVPSNIVNTTTSPSGHPAVEISTGIVVDDGGGEDRRDRPIGEDVPIHETEEKVASRPARVDASYVPADTSAVPDVVPEPTVVSVEPAGAAVIEPVFETDVMASTPAPEVPVAEPLVAPAPIDLSTLTPEQLTAVQTIVHPEVSNG